MRSELFEETFKQHKDTLTNELVKLGKHRQAQLVEWDIEQNESDYEFYFNSAWNAQQSKVDDLHMNAHILSMAVYRDWETDRKSTRLNSSHSAKYRMPSSA